MTMPAVPAELPPAIAALSLDAIEAAEREHGFRFGALIDELATGRWSIHTMRVLVGLVEPEAELATLADLMAAAAALQAGKANGATG